MPDEDLLLFFSHRIGISEDRRAVPTRAGARLTGQAGGLMIGGLWMRTDDFGGASGNDHADQAGSASSPRFDPRSP